MIISVFIMLLMYLQSVQMENVPQLLFHFITFHRNLFMSTGIHNRSFSCFSSSVIKCTQFKKKKSCPYGFVVCKSFFCRNVFVISVGFNRIGKTLEIDVDSIQFNLVIRMTEREQWHPSTFSTIKHFIALFGVKDQLLCGQPVFIE